MQANVRDRLDVRWYRGLVEPVLPTVASALAQVEDVSGADPWDVPRTGLGGAVVVHVARGFGSRGWKRSGRLAVLAVEAYNQRVFLGVPEGAGRDALLERDVGRLHRVWTELLERDGALVGRVLDRVFTAGTSVGDDAVPEAVLFLRGAVAAGVVAGDVPDRIHALLDVHVTWLGLAWEAAHGTLTEPAFHEALRAVGVRTFNFHSSTSPAAACRAGALRSLAALPEGPARDLFEAILDRVAPEASAPAAARDPAAWEPLLAPEPRPVAAAPRPLAAGTPLGAFHDRWRGPIEDALAHLAATDSAVLGRAVGYLRGQGGKRVRPLVTLAAAEAVGGDPARALAAAAAVEWVHQGSLVIDDVVDRAALRRGGPTLHTATSIPFAAGVAAFVFARIHRALRGMHPAIREHLVRAAAALAEGERSELAHTGDLDLTVTGYYRIIEAKTARLFSAAAAAGALSVEAGKADVRALVRFGREAGLAFQIVDDLLDYVADERVLGKRPGTDHAARKVTLPLLFLDLHGADPFALPFEAVRDAIVGQGVQELTRARAREHLARAHAALEPLPGDAGRAHLAALATRFVERDR